MIRSKGTAPFWLQASSRIQLRSNFQWPLVHTNICKPTHTHTFSEACESVGRGESENVSKKKKKKTKYEKWGRTKVVLIIHARTHTYMHVPSWTSTWTSLAFNRAYFDWDWKWHAIRSIERLSTPYDLLFFLVSEWVCSSMVEYIFAATVANAY